MTRLYEPRDQRTQSIAEQNQRSKGTQPAYQSHPGESQSDPEETPARHRRE